MDNIQSDEELVEEMKPIANKLHIKPQVAVAILLVIIIVLCILLAVGTWYFHKRYHRKQQEFAEKIIQETKQSKYASISPPILPPVHYSTMNERSLARVSVPGQVISPRTPNYEELQIDTSRLARLSGTSRHTMRRRSGESYRVDEEGLIDGYMEEGSHSINESILDSYRDSYRRTYRQSHTSTDFPHLTTQASSPYQAFRPVSTFSLGGLLDMYSNQPKCMGMGSPISPLNPQHSSRSLRHKFSTKSRKKGSSTPHDHTLKETDSAVGSRLHRTRAQSSTSLPSPSSPLRPKVWSNADIPTTPQRLPVTEEKYNAHRRVRGLSLVGEIMRMEGRSGPLVRETF